VAAVAPAEPVDASTAPEARVIHTPDAATIDSLVNALNASGELAPTGRPWTAADTLKSLMVLVTGSDGTESPLALGIPGDRDADLKRVAAQLGAIAVRPFDAEAFTAHPDIVPGYLGPARLGTTGSSTIPYLVDTGVAPGRRWVAGADEPDRHVIDVIRGRDFSPDGEIHATEVRSGDVCSCCGGSLQIDKGAKIGQLARVGTDVARGLGLTVLDGDGKPVTVAIGAYRLGVSQAVGAIAEQHHDDKGLRWPAAVAPADVHVLAVGRDDAPFEAAAALAGTLDAMGLTVLLDDRRDARPGVKFADAELIGVPIAVVVGKGLASGLTEVRDRRTGASRDVRVDEAASYLNELTGGWRGDPRVGPID
jgi:prolyl-tRNA synthetase